MSKLLVVCSLLFALTVFASPTLANESSNSAKTPYSNKMERIEIQNTIKQNRMASRAAVMEDKMASKAARMSKKEEFKEKLQNITDEQKKEIVEKIDARIASMNTKQTSMWMEALTKMESVLARISEQATTLKSQGENTTALESAIANAQTAVTNAKTAVNTQAAKEYVITITSESALRTNVGSTVSQFKSDTRTTRQSVTNARAAVVKAFVELAKLTKPTLDGNASNSGMMRVQ